MHLAILLRLQIVAVRRKKVTGCFQHLWRGSRMAGSSKVLETISLLLLGKKPFLLLGSDAAVAAIVKNEGQLMFGRENPDEKPVGPADCLN